MSKALIESFRSGHRSIISSIDQIQQSLRSYSQVKPAIRELNGILSSHLARQDGAMFRKLHEFYREERGAEKMLEFLLHDLKDIRIQYLIFTENHSGELGDVHSRNFIRNFQDFSRQVIERIRIEEEYLFPLLEKMPSEDC
ncbi:MAG: hemerythrin domain-containing protein [Candidatus Omnitrophota bacterium]